MSTDKKRPVTVAAADHPARRRKSYNLTEMGNAERLANQHRFILRFCRAWGNWLIYDGCRWQRDETGQVEQLAKQTVRSMYKNAAAITDDKRRGGLTKHALKSETKYAIHAMIELAGSHLAVAPAELDKDPWLLNVLNGTINLRTGRLRKHRAEDFITKLAPVVYDPDAELGRWLEFLDRVVPDQRLRSFLQRAVGYSLTGDTREELLFFIGGPTATGKSTFIEALKAALGDYAKTADFDTFLRQNNPGRPRNDIARLAGARLVVGIEVEQGKRLAEGLVKQITGKDTVTARFLYKEPFEFIPQFKLWLVANDKPVVRGDDLAMWRRIKLVPFEQTIPKDERKPAVKAQLTDPKIGGPAVLTWAVRGCKDWHKHGLGTSATVDAATEAYQEEMDPLAGFLSEKCVLDPGAIVKRDNLYAAYQNYMQDVDDTGMLAIGKRGFAESLKARGMKPEALQGQGRVWKGIRLDNGHA